MRVALSLGRVFAGRSRRELLPAVVVSLLLVLMPVSAPGEGRRTTRIGDRYYVSVNDAAVLLGATKFWRSETRKVVLNVEGTRITVTVGSPVVLAGNKTFLLTVPVVFRQGTVYIPVELFSDMLPQVVGRSFLWDQETTTLSVMKRGTTPVTVSLETFPDLTSLVIESSQVVDYAQVSASAESFMLVIENASLFGRPVPSKGGLVRQLKVRQSGSQVSLSMILDPDVLGYSIKKEKLPDRIVIRFTSMAALMQAEGFSPFGRELPKGTFKVVVIDPGHGGSDDGARGVNGCVEKDVTMEIAREVRRMLSESQGLEVVLTRDGDVNVSAERRAAVANASGGNLFVSIHCDAYAASDAGGFSVETYKASEVTSSRREEVGGVEMRRWKAVPERHARASISLAGALSESLAEVSGLKDLGLRRLPLTVLEGVNMPSVAVNVGFVTNSADEALLQDDASRSRISSGVARGIRDFISESAR
ncbi:MAG: N-acetylmuramoyl-L-alanine amidase [Candidatus Eisenbacteria bacterium]